MKARWNNMTTADRIINVLIIVLSVAVIGDLRKFCVIDKV